MIYVVPHHPCPPDWAIALKMIVEYNPDPMVSKCKNCSAPIQQIDKHKPRAFCNNACKSGFTHKMMAGKAKAAIKPKAPTGPRKLKCAGCGKTFIGRSHNAKSCSEKCRKAYNREKERDARSRH